MRATSTASDLSELVFSRGRSSRGRPAVRSEGCRRARRGSEDRSASRCGLAAVLAAEVVACGGLLRRGAPVMSHAGEAAAGRNVARRRGPRSAAAAWRAPLCAPAAVAPAASAPGRLGGVERAAVAGDDAVKLGQRLDLIDDDAAHLRRRCRKSPAAARECRGASRRASPPAPAAFRRPSASCLARSR